MSEQPQTPEAGGDNAGETPADTPAPIEAAEVPQPVTEAPQPAAAAAPLPPLPPPPGPAPSAAGTAAAADRPEIAVGAAFAGGLLFAMILKRLAR